VATCFGPMFSLSLMNTH